MKEKLKVNDIKILLCVKEFNDLGFFPHVNGIIRILQGEDHPLLSQFKEFKTYQVCSLKSKKISIKATFLVRNGYLKYQYDEKCDEMFLVVTEKGKEMIDEYLAKNVSPFKKVKKKEVVLFVKQK